MKTPACLWHLWSSCDWQCEISIRKRKLQFSSNSSQIDLSSLTHSVPWVVEELDAVDSERYPWFNSSWPAKESIGRTDHFVAGASSDIIFWRDAPIVVFWVFTNHDVFTLFFRNHFLCFLLPFFFFKVQSKIGVRIIHGCALYKGKYGSYGWEEKHSLMSLLFAVTEIKLAILQYYGTMCCCKNCTRIIFKFDFNLLWVKHSLSSSWKGIWYCENYCTKILPSVLLTVLWTYFVIEAKIYFLQGHNLISETHFHIVGNLHQDQGSKFQWLPYKNQTGRQPFHCGGRCGCAGRKG